MNTLCTQATSSLSSNAGHSSACAVATAQTHRKGSVATAALAKLRKSITQFFVTHYNRRIDRQAFNNVLTLDDRTLKDIGVTRQDVMWAKSKKAADGQ